MPLSFMWQGTRNWSWCDCSHLPSRALASSLGPLPCTSSTASLANRGSSSNGKEIAYGKLWSLVSMILFVRKIGCVYIAAKCFNWRRKYFTVSVCVLTPSEEAWAGPLCSKREQYRDIYISNFSSCKMKHTLIKLLLTLQCIDPLHLIFKVQIVLYCVLDY